MAGDPKQLKNFNVFILGVGYLGKATEAELPDIEVKTQDYRGAGMLGDIEIQQGIEKMELTVTMAGGEPVIFENFGLAESEKVQLRLEGAEQDSAGAVRRQTVHANGFVKKITDGTWKPGDPAPPKFTLSLRYYKREIDGAAKLEVDFDDNKLVVNGVDQYAAINQALGIS